MELTQIQQLILATLQLREIMFKIWQVACIQDVIGTRETFSYAAMNSKHRKIKGLTKPRIKK